MTNRRTRWGLITVGLTTCISFCAFTGFAQTLQIFTNRKEILIGEQIELKIKANLPTTSLVMNKWVAVPVNIPHFDIVETGKLDTIHFKDGSTAIEQKIRFTSFDSGRWAFPSMAVEFDGANGEPPVRLQTDSFFVNVSYSPPDGTNALRDIKPIIQVSISDYFWYYIAGGAALLLLIVFLLYRYFKKRKGIHPTSAKSGLSPYDEAMEALKKLEQKDMQTIEGIKEFHTRLSEITKIYLGRKHHTNLLNETTGDLLVRLKGIDLPVDCIASLATALRCSDAVKFAKFLPPPDETAECLLAIREGINNIETSKQVNK